MSSKRFLFIFLILALASQACSSIGSKVSPNDVLFSDDFTDTSRKWDQSSDATHTTGYYNSSYRITVNEVSSNIWANPDSESFTDTRIEVDATKNSGPEDNLYGVICRYTGVDQFYYAVISSDGYYAISKMTSSGVKQIGHDKMLQSDKITQGGATNHIRFDCVGSTLALYVNSKQVDLQKDSDYSTGNVGLIAGTFTNRGTDILFDNFYVYKP